MRTHLCTAITRVHWSIFQRRIWELFPLSSETEMQPFPTFATVSLSIDRASAVRKSVGRISDEESGKEHTYVRKQYNNCFHNEGGWYAQSFSTLLDYSSTGRQNQGQVRTRPPRKQAPSKSDNKRYIDSISASIHARNRKCQGSPHQRRR